MSKIKIGDYIWTTDHDCVDHEYRNLIGIIVGIDKEFFRIDTKVREGIPWTILNENVSWIYLGEYKPMYGLINL